MRLYDISIFLFILNFVLAILAVATPFSAVYPPYLSDKDTKNLQSATDQMIPKTGVGIIDASLGLGKVILNGFIIFGEVFLTTTIGLPGFIQKVGFEPIIAITIGILINLVYVAGIVQLVTGRDIGS